MISLSLFCSSDSVSLALFDKEKEILFLQKKTESKNKSDILIALIKKLFENFSSKKLRFIYFSRGPGSFTSIRSLVSIAQGIRLSNKSKIMTTTIFEIFLFQILKNKKPVLFVYKDSRRDFYFQFFDFIDLKFVKVSRILSGDILKINKKVQKFLKEKQMTKLFTYSNETHDEIKEISNIQFQELSIDARSVFQAINFGFASKRISIIYHHPHYGKRINN